MPVRVDATELIELLRQTPASQNVMLVGRHGIGKSEILSSHYGQLGIEVVSFFLGQMSDPGDLIGLLDKDETTGRSEFLPPYWWPRSDEPVVLFLDELNRARPEILQSVMELALNKTLAGKRLPDGSRIVAAVNDGDEYQITDLDPALVSRFNVYEFAPSVDDWLLWAERNAIDERVIAFIQKQPQYLDGEGHNHDGVTAPAAADYLNSSLHKTPDRRGWARVSALIDGIELLGSLHIKLVAGVVGSAAATAFRKSLATPLPVTAAEALLDFATVRKKIEKLSLGELILLNEQLLLFIGGGKLTADVRPQARENLLSFLKLLRKRKLDEAVAHFVSMVDKPKYEAAMTLCSESVELTQLMTDYMEGIQVS